MTLDEAIEHAEKVAEENQRVVDTGVLYDDVTIAMLFADDTEVIEEHLANYQSCAEEHKQLAEWLKELKHLREQPRWIPCSERLPDKEGTYLLWGKLADDEDCYCFIGNYDEGCEQFGDWQEQFDAHTLGCLGSEFYEYECVLAWQPLPKPYEPKESEDKE